MEKNKCWGDVKGRDWRRIKEREEGSLRKHSREKDR